MAGIFSGHLLRMWTSNKVTLVIAGIFWTTQPLFALDTTTKYVTDYNCLTSTALGQRPPLKTLNYTKFDLSTRHFTFASFESTYTFSTPLSLFTAYAVTTTTAIGGTRTIITPTTSYVTLSTRITYTPTFLFTSTITTTGPGTLSTAYYGASAGYTPLATVIGNGLPRSDSADVRCTLATIEYDDTSQTFAGTATVTAPRSTVYYTTTLTQFTGATPTTTITFYSGTYTDIQTTTSIDYASTVTDPRTIYTTRTISPAISSYAACASNNMISAVRTAPVGAIPTYDSLLNAAFNLAPADCCNLCQSTPDCAGYAAQGFNYRLCLNFRGPRVCDGSATTWRFFTNSSSPANQPWIIGDGPCGQGQYTKAV